MKSFLRPSSLPTADSSRAVVSHWQKGVHLVLVNRLGRLPRNSVVRLTDGSPYVPQVPGFLKIRHYYRNENNRLLYKY